MTEIINCTPHCVNIVDENNQEIAKFESCGIIPRLSTETQKVDTINGISITATIFGECKDLPKERKGTMLIVPRLILAAHPNRKDLLVPNELVRNEKGHIIGCRSLAVS